jgi:hypothetical protein
MQSKPICTTLKPFVKKGVFTDNVAWERIIRSRGQCNKQTTTVDCLARNIISLIFVCVTDICHAE